MPQRLIPLALLTLLLGGCGGVERPPMGQVSGKVTYQGKPLEVGEVVFNPVSGETETTGQPASGALGSGGYYRLSTFDDGDGAVVGDHIITIKSSEVIRSAKPSKNDTEGIQTPGPDGKLSYMTLKSRVPKRYANPMKSGLRRTVKEGKNEVDIELTD